MKLSDRLGLQTFSCGAYTGIVQPEHFLTVLDGIGAARIAEYGPRHEHGTIQGEADGYPVSYNISCDLEGGRLRIYVLAHWARASDPVLAGRACFYWKMEDDGTESEAEHARIAAALRKRRPEGP